MQDNSNDTTLKLREFDTDDVNDRNNHNDTTLKINQSSSNCGETSPEKGDKRKTFVINITLQGVPSKNKDEQDSRDSNKTKQKSDKHKTDTGRESKSEHKSSKHRGETNKDSKLERKSSKNRGETDKESKSGHKIGKNKDHTDKESKSVIKSNKNKDDTDQESKSENTKPTGKRKLKALFGESSESEAEPKEPKRAKLTEDQKNKHKHKHKKKHSKQKKDDKKPEKTDDTKIKESSDAVNQPSSFDNGSDSESEKELVIDDDSESHAKANVTEKTLVLNSSERDRELNDSNDSKISAHEISDNVEPQSNAEESKSLQEPHENDQNELNISDLSVVVEVDEKKLTKAYRLSLEADKVLENLKKFAEMPQEELVIPVDKPVEEKNIVPDDVSQPETKPDKHRESSKHRRRLSLSKQKEYKELKESKHEKHDNARHKEKKKEKHDKKKEGNVAKKTEKVDVASLVVKLLMPYYKNKKITNRDLFKITARHIVHQLLAIQVTGKQFLR